MNIGQEEKIFTNTVQKTFLRELNTSLRDNDSGSVIVRDELGKKTKTNKGT